MGLEEELRQQYERFEGRGRGSESMDHADAQTRVLVGRPGFLSRNAGYLLEIDREIQSNISFYYLLFLPGRLEYGTCLILSHGFNETNYVKLFPWAHCLCKALNMPVIVFPLSFHINRRPMSWQHLMLAAYRNRKGIRNNACQSPFNAVVSQRMSEQPERFFRGALQSYSDSLELIKEIVNGSLEVSVKGDTIRPFREDTDVHFLGYSISGYLYLSLLLIHGQGLLRNSLCLLFSTCSSWEDMNPVSILVIDREAYIAAGEFYTSGHRKKASSEFTGWLRDTEVGMWFERLFLEGSKQELHREVQRLDKRLMMIADPKDPVFPVVGIVKNLGEGIQIRALDLGRHEFPFNISRLEGRSLSEIAPEIRESYVPSTVYWPSFRTWLEWVTAFFDPSQR